MSVSARTLFSLLAIGLTSACVADGVTSAPASPDDLRVLAGKARAIPQARLTFYPTMPDNNTPTAVVGDGRLANGGPSSGNPSVYEGGVCGVKADIQWDYQQASGWGDLVFDPDDGARCTGGARKLNITGFGLVGPSMNFREIMQLAVDSSRVHQLNMSVAAGGCARVQYRDDVGSTVRVTRLSDDPSTGRRSWRAESGGSHLAACDVSTKGGYQFTGTTYYLPMHVLIEDIR